MRQMPRLRPNPIPAVRLLPEYLAEGETAQIYADIKTVLQVPWVGVLGLAYARYPTFFARFWSGMREVCASEAFLAMARDLRGLAEANARSLGPETILDDVTALGYAAREIDAIRTQIEIFSHGNHVYFPIALAARALMEGMDFGRPEPATAFEGRHGPTTDVPFVLMEAHHADSATQALYGDVKATLGLPFVNTDYRALCRWPTYFQCAWKGLKPLISTSDYDAMCLAYHTRGLELANSLPNPSGLNPEALREAAEQDASIDELIDCTRVFAYLIPGLTLNVAILRQQLAEA